MTQQISTAVQAIHFTRKVVPQLNLPVSRSAEVDAYFHASTPQPASAIALPAGTTVQLQVESKPSAKVPPCCTHPDAPHGFNRDASHSIGRYVCDCEGWVPEYDEETVRADAKRFQLAISQSDHADTLHAAVINNFPSSDAIREEFDRQVLF